MKKHSIIYLLLILVYGFANTSCSDDDEKGIRFYHKTYPETKERKTTSITVPISFESVRVAGLEGDNRSAKSSNENVATVSLQDDYLNITAARPGKATITVTDGHNSATLAVEVTEIKTKLFVLSRMVNVQVEGERHPSVENLEKYIDGRLLNKGDRYELTYEESQKGKIACYKENDKEALKTGVFAYERTEEGYFLILTFDDAIVRYRFQTSYPAMKETRSSAQQPIYLIEDYSHLYAEYPDVKFTVAEGALRVLQGLRD